MAIHQADTRAGMDVGPARPPARIGAVVAVILVATSVLAGAAPGASAQRPDPVTVVVERASDSGRISVALRGPEVAVVAAEATWSGLGEDDLTSYGMPEHAAGAPVFPLPLAWGERLSTGWLKCTSCSPARTPSTVVPGRLFELHLGTQADVGAVQLESLRLLTVDGRHLVGRPGKAGVAAVIEDRGPAPASRWRNAPGRVTRSHVSADALLWQESAATGACERSDGRSPDCVPIASLLDTVALSSSTAATAAAEVAYVVDSNGDRTDASPGNGVCRTSLGTCTLRAAIVESNLDGAPSTIAFDIPGTLPHTIQLGGSLPSITDLAGPTTIDGYTQPGTSPNSAGHGSNAVIGIQIRGTGTTSTGMVGLRITSPANVLRGLSFFDLKRSIVVLDGDDNRFLGNFIGTDAAGEIGAPTKVNGSAAIAMEQGSARNVVGTPSLADRNVLSGNGTMGVGLFGGGTSQNVVQNNIVGLGPTGARLPNRRHGIDLNVGASNNQIGGLDANEGNVVSGNDVDGIEISHATGTRGNRIEGNHIGTTVDGSAVAGHTVNRGKGVRIEDHVDDNIVRGNVIVNNGGGVELRFEATDTVVEGNYIGVLPDGTAAPNGVVTGGSDVAVIVRDGVQRGAIRDNTIRSHAGVRIGGDGSAGYPVTNGVTVSRNSIRGVGSRNVGIDLEPWAAVNANDPGDTDGGPNGRLNHPVVTSATSVRVTGTACTSCVIEGFLTGAPLGAHGPGESYLASTTADATGAFSWTVPAEAVGKRVTFTATDTGGSTSEYGTNVDVPGATGRAVVVP